MNKYRILLVENDSNWTDIEKSVLGSLGYEVVTKRDSTEAIKYLNLDKDIDLIISDLHMGGPDKNGDFLLEHIIQNNLPIRFALASGTIAPKDKEELRENIPFMYTLAKDDFLKSNLLKENIEYILKQNPSDYHNKQGHLRFLNDFKNRLAPPGIRVHADRIKGRTLNVANHFREQLGEFYGQLLHYSYFETDDKGTQRQLHDLKNILSGYAINQLPEGSELYKVLLRIADNIAVIVNQPSDEKMSLFEIVSRARSNLDLIYKVTFNVEIQHGITVSTPSKYINALHALIENSAIASSESNSSVNIYFKKGRLYIENIGSFPREFLDDNGYVIPGKVKPKSKHQFGTGLGIENTVGILKETGSELKYELGKDKVRAVISLEPYEDKGKTQGSKRKILVYDSIGDKCRHIKDAYESGQFPDCEIDFKMKIRDKLEDIDPTGYDIALLHLNFGLVKFLLKVIEKNPSLKIHYVSGSFSNETFKPDSQDDFYLKYRVELDSSGYKSQKPMENATYLGSTAPSLEIVKQIFRGHQVNYSN